MDYCEYKDFERFTKTPNHDECLFGDALKLANKYVFKLFDESKHKYKKRT